MIMLANTQHARRDSATPQLFRKMARAIRMMAAMQLVPADVARLLRPAPARDVDVVFYLGYTCGGSGADRSPALKAKLREATLSRMREPGIDALVSLYHGCHMQLAAAGQQQGFPVVNFTELLVRGLGGTPRSDALDALRIDGNLATFASQVAPQLRASGIDFDEHELAGLLPDLLSLAEFRGGLTQFDAPRSA